MLWKIASICLSCHFRTSSLVMNQFPSHVWWNQWERLSGEKLARDCYIYKACDVQIVVILMCCLGYCWRLLGKTLLQNLRSLFNRRRLPCHSGVTLSQKSHVYALQYLPRYAMQYIHVAGLIAWVSLEGGAGGRRKGGAASGGAALQSPGGPPPFILSSAWPQFPRDPKGVRNL